MELTILNMSRRELNRVVERYEWFSTARRVRATMTGEPDPALALPLIFWPLGVEVEHETAPKDVIDRFIENGVGRISPDAEVAQVIADVEIDPAMVTAQLAEIYRAQGLDEEAEKIYRLLNLGNS